MQFPTKQVLIDNTETILKGISEDDPYFAAIGDEYEPAFVALCRRYIHRSFNCLDIGANIGVKALLMARLASEGRVIAVEPSPVVHNCLAANLAANAIRNVELHATAISDRDGTAKFIEASAYGHLSDGGLEVPVTTLPNLVARAGLSQVDFIKIDVEGFEYPILKNSIDLINHHKSLVLFEMNSWCQIANTDTSPKDFTKWVLENFKYVFVLDHGGHGETLLLPFEGNNWRRLLHRNIVEDRCVTDILVTNFHERLIPIE